MRCWRRAWCESRCLILLATLLALGWTAPASGRNVFVATTGSDRNPGSEARPKATIAAGIALLPRAGGGTVYIRGGTYALDKTLDINRSGASDAERTVICSYPGETVKIVGSGSDNTVNVGASFVTLSGVEISQASPETTGKYGILIWQQHHVTVTGCTIHHLRDSGIFVGSGDYDPVAKTSGANNLLFEGNTVHHACVNNSAQVERPGWGQGVSSFFSVGTVYRNNTVYKNWGEGINLCCNDGALIEGNTISDNYSVNLYLDHATNATIRNNLLYTSEDSDRGDWFPYWSRNTSPGNGILLANERTDKQTNKGHRIYNNISINCGSGVHISGSFADGLIAHNTFIVAPKWGVGLGGGEEAVNCSLLNNIIVSSGRALGGVSEKGQWTCDRNLYFGGSSGGTRGAHEIRVNPGFITGTGLNADGYRLRRNSPAINAAVAAPEVRTDYWGVPRPQGAAADIGACEFEVKKRAASTSDKDGAARPTRAAPPKPARVALPGAVDEMDAMLFERLREALAEGAQPSVFISSVRQRVRVQQIDEERTVHVTGGDITMALAWKRLSPSDKQSLIGSVLREGEALDHVLAAFYLLVEGKEEPARTHLANSGEYLELLNSFFVETEAGANADGK